MKKYYTFVKKDKKMCIEIYFATHRVAITSDPDSSLGHIVEERKLISPESVVEQLEKFDNIVVLTPEPEATFQRIASLFKAVTAAGGVVANTKGEELMIFRNGRWDLPKGHHEKGETIEECAVREVTEETGVGEITLGSKIGTTLHAYKMRGVWELKQTHWYSMTSTHTAELVPQTEEGIERVEWITPHEIEIRTLDSFPTIRKVFDMLR